MMNEYWRLREATATTEREGATRAVRYLNNERQISFIGIRGAGVSSNPESWPAPALRDSELVLLLQIE